MNILVADDDAEDRFIIHASFAELNLGHLVQFAEDGEKAVALLHTLSPEELPSLIILDQNMPLMNGKEALQAIKSTKKLAHIPVIIFSTSISDTEHKQCLAYGADQYITKPLSYEEYVSIARQMAERCGYSFATP